MLRTIKNSGEDVARQNLQRWLEKHGDDDHKAKRTGLAGSLFRAIYRLLTALQAQDSTHSTLAEKRQCALEIERLFLWGDGIGAADGDLDDTLDTSVELRISTLSLLYELGSTVTESLFRIIDPREPAVRELCADTITLMDTTSAVLDEFGHKVRTEHASSDSDTSEQDFAEVIEELSTFTDCLMDITPALEHPATDLELTGASFAPETFQVSTTMAANYCRKIRDRFPELDVRLVERLGIANEDRSTRLRESLFNHAEATSKQADGAEDISEPLFSRSGGRQTETTRSSFAAGSIFSANEGPKHGMSKEEYDDVASQTTFATFSTAFSVAGRAVPRIPTLPDSARAGKPFECVACGKVVSGIRNRRVWKKHVFNDLQPYNCLATVLRNESCSQAFSTRTAWIKHEIDHIGSDSQQITCPFCPSTKASQPAAMQLKHISRHLREVALAVLPQSHESDSDSDVGSNASDGSLSDVSSLHDSVKLDGMLAPTRSRAPSLSPQSSPWSSKPSSVISRRSSASLDQLAAGDTAVPESADHIETSGSDENHDAPTNARDESGVELSVPAPQSSQMEKSTDSRETMGASQQAALVLEDTVSQEATAPKGGNDETSKPTLQPCKYKTGKTIKAGSYSVVKECVHIETGRYYAAKVINKKLMAGREQLVRNEIAVLKKVSMGHQNILTLVDYFETLHNLYLVTDLALGGELFDRICRKGSFLEKDTAHIIMQVVSAVAYLHDHDIVHRGLKAENLLFRTPEEDADVLIADFGEAKFIGDDEWNRNYLHEDRYPGLDGCQAPEMFTSLSRMSNVGKPVDVWAIGFITYFLLCGYTPFDRDNPREETEAILNADFSFTPVEYWRNVSTDARHFITQCLTLSPEHRMTAHEALRHPFLTRVTKGVVMPSTVPPVRRWKLAINVVMAAQRYARGPLISRGTLR